MHSHLKANAAVILQGLDDGVGGIVCTGKLSQVTYFIKIVRS